MVKVFPLFVFLSVSPARAQLTADFICQMNATNNGMATDVNAANQATFYTAVGAGTWSINGNPMHMWVSNNAAYAFFSPVQVNAFTYPGGDQGWVSDYSVPTNYMQYRFNGPGTNRVSLGMFMWFTGLGNSFASINDGYIGGQGDFASISISDDGNVPPHPHIGIETAGFQTTKNFEIANNTVYWVTILFLQNGNAQFSFYNASTGFTLLGTTNAVLSNVGCDRIFIGRSDAHQLFPNITGYHAGLVVSYGTGIFPLGPGGGGLASMSVRGLTVKGMRMRGNRE